MVLKSREIG